MKNTVPIDLVVLYIRRDNHLGLYNYYYSCYNYLCNYLCFGNFLGY